MTRAELAKEVKGLIAADVSLGTIEDIIAQAVHEIMRAVANGESVTLVGFGSFQAADRKAREGRNPQDPTKTIHIPAKRVPVFKAGKIFREAVDAQKGKVRGK